MKRSNKILIGLAAALIIIPLLSMIYDSRVYYKPGSYEDLADVRQNEDASFETASANMKSLSLSTFSGINISADESAGLSVQVIKDKASGLKIPDAMTSVIDAKVDANGILQIVVKADKENRYTTLIVYGPSARSLTVDKASRLSISSHIDSLDVMLKNIEHVSFTRMDAAMALSLKTDRVKEVAVNNETIGSLNLDLDDTNFTSRSSSYGNLWVKAGGKSKIEIRGEYAGEGQQAAAYSIKHLQVNTLGENTFSLTDIQVADCSGSFSDGTKILAMPAVNLNQLYKRK